MSNIRESLRNFSTFVTESLATFEKDHSCPPSFANFVRETGVSPLTLLKSKTWSEWRSLARHLPPPADLDLDACRQAHRRILLRTDPDHLARLARYADPGQPIDESSGLLCEPEALSLHYLLWGKKGGDVGARSLAESLSKWRRNASAVRDLAEIVDHVRRHPVIPTTPLQLPFPCGLRLHAAYGSNEIKAALGMCTLERPGPTGVGVLHSEALKCYVHLVTFRKSEQDFSPSTQYRDYPVSRGQLHWETQSTVSQASPTGQNLLHFKQRGYTILFFARLEKRVEDETAPFIFLGPARNLVSAEADRPISMVWELDHEMPAVLFEEARAN